MNKLKKKKAGIKDFFKGKHGRNFLLALDVLLAIAFFAQPDLYYNPQAPDFFDRFYADSLIICGGLWAVLVFLTVKKIHFSVIECFFKFLKRGYRSAHLIKEKY